MILSILESVSFLASSVSIFSGIISSCSSVFNGLISGSCINASSDNRPVVSTFSGKDKVTCTRATSSASICRLDPASRLNNIKRLGSLSCSTIIHRQSSSYLNISSQYGNPFKPCTEKIILDTAMSLRSLKLKTMR